MIIVSKYIVPKGYFGLTLFPFIVLKRKELLFNKILVNHEKIHLRQQLELLIIPFYLLYFIEFIIRYAKLKDWQQTYRSISFEREAYINEQDSKFLKKRPFWNFINYF
ncbi:hypothetical protein [Winogradskyella jejuensis]|uniref:Peptidase M56 domain-containing protein n=1 Tax=Winogradskyella jejuensis TaxID=1089305 RepID=A0A1M5PM75_9FLAO|nr:hypothetical protein [Winogradskyella jejuensis]SHH02864.1 hypothetical protein SAMN05444148_1533 [Winogradskyella jejuensis]